MAAKGCWYVGVRTVFRIAKDMLPGAVSQDSRISCAAKKCNMQMENLKQHLVDGMACGVYQNPLEHSPQESSPWYDGPFKPTPEVERG